MQSTLRDDAPGGSQTCRVQYLLMSLSSKVTSACSWHARCEILLGHWQLLLMLELDEISTSASRLKCVRVQVQKKSL